MFVIRRREKKKGEATELRKGGKGQLAMPAEGRFSPLLRLSMFIVAPCLFGRHQKGGDFFLLKKRGGECLVTKSAATPRSRGGEKITLDFYVWGGGSRRALQCGRDYWEGRVGLVFPNTLFLGKKELLSAATPRREGENIGKKRGQLAS